MSVIVLEPKEFGEIGTTLLLPTHRDYLLTVEELSYARNELKADIAGWQAKLVRCWCDRLYIANQLASDYSYSEEISVRRLQEEDFQVQPLTDRKLYSQLCSLRYNILTNGGNTFLGRKDHDMLDHQIDFLAYKLIRSD